MNNPHPAAVEVAQRDRQPVLLDLVTYGGLTFDGPGGDDVARAVLLGVLARGGDSATNVLATPETSTGSCPAPEHCRPRCAVRWGRAARHRRNGACASGPAARRRRRRRRADDDADFPSYRAQQPEEGLPALILLTAAPIDDPERLRAVLVAGQRLGIGALLLGDTMTTHQLSFDEHGALGAVTPLGTYRLYAGGTEVRYGSGLREASWALLAYCLLHPTGATSEVAIGALWPDLDERSRTEQFRNAVRSIRSVLRPYLDTVSKIIEPTGTSFRADPDLFDDVDLWRLEHALRQAATAPDDVGAIAALAAIADLYPGDLLDSLYHEWAAPEREDLRRRVPDALSRLAHLAEKHDRPNDALIALDRAIALDPYAEGLYQHAMRIHGDLGRPDAVRRLYRQLENRLVDIDAEPDEQTARLLDQPTLRSIRTTENV